MKQQKFFCRGDVSDYVLMEGRGFGFVTFQDPAHAQSFLEVIGTPSVLVQFSLLEL